MNCVRRREMAAEGKAIESQEGVSFVVSFNECPPKQRRLPKGLAARREQRHAKASLTEQSIAEKQKKAEERRQKLKEEKLERLHQLEEDMAGLARKMQAHQEAENSTNSPATTTAADSHSGESGTNSHLTNGVVHHPK